MAENLNEAVAAMNGQGGSSKSAGSSNGKPTGKTASAGNPAPPNQYIGAEIVGGDTPNTSGTDFRGIVGLLVAVDEKGKPVGCVVQRTSGRKMIDQVAINSVYRLQFSPAIDDRGMPRRVVKFVFDGSSPHRFDDDENKRIRAARQIYEAQKANSQNQ